MLKVCVPCRIQSFVPKFNIMPELFVQIHQRKLSVLCKILQIRNILCRQIAIVFDCTIPGYCNDISIKQFMMFLTETDTIIAIRCNLNFILCADGMIRFYTGNLSNMCPLNQVRDCTSAQCTMLYSKFPE